MITSHELMTLLVLNNRTQFYLTMLNEIAEFESSEFLRMNQSLSKFELSEYFRVYQSSSYLSLIFLQLNRVLL